MKILFFFLLTVLCFILTFIVQTLGAKCLLLILAMLFFKWGSHLVKLSEKKRDEMLKKETEELLDEYPHTQSTISTNYLNALLIDEPTQTFFFAKREDTDCEFDVKEYVFNEIYETAIEENGEQIALISRGGLLGGTILNSASNSLVYIMESENNNITIEDEEEESEETEKNIEEGISKLSLKVVVDDLSNPIIEFVFFENDEQISKEDKKYKEASKLCKKWHQMISVLIKRQDQLNRVIINRYDHSNGVI